MSPLLILSILSAAVPVIIGIVKKRTTLLLWYYPLTGLFFDLLISFIKRYLHLNNGVTANMFMLTEFLLLSFIYRDRIFKNKTVFYLFIMAMSVFFIAQTIKKSIFHFNMEDGSFLIFSYIIYSILGFYHILKQEQIVLLDKSWFFWLNVAILLYSCGAFPLFLFKRYPSLVDSGFFLQLWEKVFYILNTTKNLLFVIVLYHYTQSNKYES